MKDVKKKEDKKVKLFAESVPMIQHEWISSFETWNSANGYVSWGLNNLFPQALWLLIQQSPTIFGILNRSIEFTKGNKITLKKEYEVNELGETMLDVILKSISDYWYFGGFALQVVYNGFGEIISIGSVDFRKCRINREFTRVYLNSRFINVNFTDVTKDYHVFNPEHGAEHGIQIYYHRPYNLKNIYPLPAYYSALRAIEIEKEIFNFHYNSLINDFVGSTIISFNNGRPTEEVALATNQKIKEKFCGTVDKQKLLVTYSDDKEHGVEIHKLQSDRFDEKYEKLREDVQNAIFISMGAIPQLFGNMKASTGFNSQEFSESFKLYNRTAIIPVQDEINRIFSKILGIENFIEFTPFSLEVSDIQNQAL